jgi:hypothetical protein
MLTAPQLEIIFVISALLLASRSEMKNIYLLALLFSLTVQGYAQQATTGTPDRRPDRFAAVEAAQRELLDSIYAVRTGTTYAFINGAEYYPYHYRAKNKPLLFYGTERTSDIIVKGRKYDDMVLQYDTFTDEVIFSEMDNGFGQNRYNISITRDFISAFTLFFRTDTLRFRYLNDNDTGGDIPEGFYEMAYEGPTGYIIRHRAVVHQRNGIDEYYYSPVGYVKTPSGYSKITSGGKLAKQFGPDSEVMKQIVAQRKIKLRKANKRQIINILQSFDNQRGTVREL